MATDLSIYQGFLQRPRSAVEYAGDFANLDATREQTAGNALARSFNQAKLDEFGRQTQDANALRELQRSLAGRSEAEVLKGYRDAGRFNEAGALEKDMLGRQKLGAEIGKEAALTGKATADTEKTTLETRSAKAEKALRDIAALSNPQEARASLDAHFRAGNIDEMKYRASLATIPQDPAAFPVWQVNMLKSIMTAKDQLAHQLETQKAAETGRHNRSTEGLTARGQNMVDARTKEAATAAQFIPVDGVGLYYADKRTGTARPATDPGGQPIVPNKPLTEGQAKANLFGTRMQESDAILGQLAAQGVNAPSLPQQVTGGQGLSGMAATAAASPQQQQVDQAQRDFINAVLRRESGAAIALSEFENARRQYFVQPGDKPEVIAQKARNRQTAIGGMMAEVPEAKRGIPKSGAQAAAVPDDIAALLKKHGAK